MSTKRKATPRAAAAAKKWSFETLMVPYAVIVLAIILGGMALWLHNKEYAQTMPNDTYQAVFLSNGQVYFGKLAPLNRDYMKLSDVYYLQQSQSEALTEEAAAETAETTAEEATTQTEFAVFRLGETEIHQPTNEIILSREHIIMWENMEPTSQVIDAINREKVGE